MLPKFYQVGGSIRDNILGIKSKDIDYSVEALSYNDMKDAILNLGGKIFLETPEYFTIRANVPNFGNCDFVLCRKDGEYSDGRRPDLVSIGSIFDDLARRDFTVNAIAYNSESKEYIDPHGGVDDCLNKVIRCVGSTEKRFKEDGLRILRALRFCVTKSFQLDRSIIDFIRNNDCINDYLKGVSIERVREELFKMFKHDTEKSGNLLFVEFPQFSQLFRNKKLWLIPTLQST